MLGFKEEKKKKKQVPDLGGADLAAVSRDFNPPSLQPPASRLQPSRRTLFPIELNIPH
jgi:hypothetical protein